MKKQLLTTALIAGLTVASVQANVPSVAVEQEGFMAVENAAQYKASSKVMQSRFQLSGTKVLKSYELQGGAATMQIVKDNDGFIHKRYVVKNRVLGDRVTTAKPQLKAAPTATPSYFEDFEAYKESFGYDWLPKGMTEKNTPENIPTAEDLENYINNTWMTYFTGGPFLPTSTDGESEGFIHFSYTQEVNDSTVIEAQAQDEWLITPTVTPKAKENLYFIAAVEPFSVYKTDSLHYSWETLSFTAPREVANTLKVMISQDDGKNWVEAWDVEKEIVDKKMSDMDLLFADFDYAPYKVDLSAYTGKPIKIAFRYLRVKDNMAGQSMCLDAIMVGIPESEACYMRPNGGFMAGFSQDYLAMNNSIMLLPPYAKNKWYNASGTYADTFEWQFQDPENPEALISYNDANPSLKYGPSVTGAPAITASVGGVNESSFSWGVSPYDPEAGAYIMYGGAVQAKNPDGEITQMGLGNFDINKRFTTHAFVEGAYCFGTGSSEIWGGTVDAIVNRFSKPAAPYVMTTLWVQCQMDADPDAEFNLVVHKVDNWGYMRDTLAVSSAFANQAVAVDVQGEKYYSIPFKFYKEDEFGYEVEAPLVVDSEIMVEFKGLNNPEKVRMFAPFGQLDNCDGPENNVFAYFLIENDAKPGEFERTLLDGSKLLKDFNSSFLFQTDAMYNWMKVDSNEFVAPVEGGSKVINVETYFDPQPEGAEFLTWWIESEDKAAMDEWITTEFTKSTKTEIPKMTITAAALPEGVDGRTAEFTLATIGASAKFNVVQGEAGVSNIVASQVAAKVANDQLVVSYPEDVNALRVFNAAGQVVVSCELPQAGQTTVDVANLEKGIYMVQFDNNQVVKFIK